jgi:hypothetical protein
MIWGRYYTSSKGAFALTKSIRCRKDTIHFEEKANNFITNVRQRYNNRKKVLLL